jgi:hypothetical protein
MFVKAEGGSVKYLDVNRMYGVTSFDQMGTFVWLHEYVIHVMSSRIIGRILIHWLEFVGLPISLTSLTLGKTACLW